MHTLTFKKITFTLLYILRKFNYQPFELIHLHQMKKSLMQVHCNVDSLLALDIFKRSAIQIQLENSGQICLFFLQESNLPLAN